MSEQPAQPQQPAQPEFQASPQPEPAQPEPAQPEATQPEVPIAQTAPVAARDAHLADGEWHRLHPASPLLKGGIALIAVLGIVINNLREWLINMFVPGYDEGGDPVDYVLDQGVLGWALLAFAVVLAVFVFGFYLSWRMHSFRITQEVVEVRSGILFRTNRKARLDRIQGINIVRPFFPRLFGAAKLEISQAGADANVQLAYLGSKASDELRRQILSLASGTRAVDEAKVQGEAAHGGVIGARVHELLAPELDPNEAPPASVVKINLGRLIGSILLSGSTIVLLMLFAAVVVVIVVWQEWSVLLGLIPAILGFGSYYVQRFTRSLRYSIAGTPDGVRVGFGLLSTSNETLPPGRIHSVLVTQPLLWRPAGWWEIKVNRASQSSAQGAAGQANTTIMPVGDHDDVMRVLGLLLPSVLATPTGADAAAAELDAELPPSALELLRRGMTAKGGVSDGFTNSPRRAAWLRWFSWRRNGFAFTDEAFLLRRGAIWRELVIVPAPRVQSVAIEQGPLGRVTRLATVKLHTVAGPISARLGAIDQAEASGFFSTAAELTVGAAARDRTHRWRSEETSA